MRLKFVGVKIWNCLRRIPMRCNWILAKTRFRIVLEYFRWDAIEFWLRQHLKLSQKNFDEMQLDFGYDTVWKCFRINIKSDEMHLNFGWNRIWNCRRLFPMRFYWILVKTEFGIVLEYFRWDAIEFWPRQNLKSS